MWSDVVVVGGKARVVTDAMFAPYPAWWLRAAAKGDVIAAVAQAGVLGTCQVVDSLGHRWNSGEVAFGVNPVGILPHPLGWEVVWMRAPSGATYARVVLDPTLTPLTPSLPPSYSPYGATSQGFLDLVEGQPLMTDQNRVKVCGPMRVYLPTTRGEWTVGQDGESDRIVAWHAATGRAFEVARVGTQVPSHLALTEEADGPAAVVIGGTPTLVYERAFVPWQPAVPVPPIPAPTPPPIPPPDPLPSPLPVPVPIPPPIPTPPVNPPPMPVPTPDPPAPVPNPPPPVPRPGKRKPNITKALKTFFNWLRRFGNTNNAKPGPPVVVVEPTPQPPTVEPTAPPVWRPTRTEVLTYRGHLCNLKDSSGGVIWTPSLPGVPLARREEWYQRLVDAGATHVPVGPFGPGEAYPGIGYTNPDWRNNSAAIRGLLFELLDAHLIPVVFTDGGPRDPKPRLRALFPVLREAIRGLEQWIIIIPCGWEPVVGDFTSAEVSWALTEWHHVCPEGIIGYHGSPTRLVGSSNPIEPDDPWQGGESDFYKRAGGEFIDIALYQTPHGRDLYTPCTCPNATAAFGHLDSCWLNRWEDYVARIGAGYHGWRILPLVLFETVAYEFFRHQVTGAEATDVARAGATVYAKWAVPAHYGNGLP